MDIWLKLMHASPHPEHKMCSTMCAGYNNPLNSPTHPASAYHYQVHQPRPEFMELCDSMLPIYCLWIRSCALISFRLRIAIRQAVSLAPVPKGQLTFSNRNDASNLRKFTTSIIPVLGFLSPFGPWTINVSTQASSSEASKLFHSPH